MGRLEGKVAVVTGAAMGIGRAVARLFAAEGAWVIAGDLADFPPAGDVRIDQRRLDVGAEESWAELGGSIAARYGRVDVLVNAAGIISYDNIVDLDPVEWERIVRVDQTGVFLGMRLFSVGLQ